MRVPRPGRAAATALAATAALVATAVVVLAGSPAA
ncbi:MAG: hypothetical protein QOK11_1200, partial [Pseudonocardiales bacterium]|nr:hypothetical protein [Pseudonocardiales bacterium]